MSFIRDLISRKRDGSQEDLSPLEANGPAGDSLKPEVTPLDALQDSEAKTLAEAPTLAQLAAEQLKSEAEAAAKKASEAVAPASTPVPAPTPAPAAAPTPAPERAAMIWDIEDDEFINEPAKPAPVAAAPAPVPAATASSARGRRTKTRLIGFEKSGGDVVDLFEATEKVTPVARAKFPVGWVLVTEGEGRGECFTLFSGLSQIGRDEDQAIQLDFGDSAISRSNHAAIVFDAESQKFLVGHGGKSNIVRLNDKPLISNEELKDGDRLRIGETTLTFKSLCGDGFSWTASEDEGEEDVAIA